MAFASIADALRAARPLTGPGRAQQLRAEVLRMIELVEALPYQWHKSSARHTLDVGEIVLAGAARTRAIRGEGHGMAHDASSLCRSIFVVTAPDTYDLLKQRARLSGGDVNAWDQDAVDAFWTDLVTVADVEIQESRYAIYSQWSSADRDEFFVPIAEDLIDKYFYRNSGERRR